MNPKFSKSNIVHMRLEGVMADAMVEISPEVYGPYFHRDKDGKSVLVVQLTKALYGCVIKSHSCSFDNYSPGYYPMSS